MWQYYPCRPLWYHRDQAKPLEKAGVGENTSRWNWRLTAACLPVKGGATWMGDCLRQPRSWTGQKGACAEHAWLQTLSPYGTWQAGRGAKANTVNISPHWLKSWTQPPDFQNAWDSGRGLLNRRWAKAHSLGLLALAVLAFCILGPLLRSTRMEACSPEAGYHAGMRASLGSSLWDVMAQCSMARGSWTASPPSPREQQTETEQQREAWARKFLMGEASRARPSGVIWQCTPDPERERAAAEWWQPWRLWTPQVHTSRRMETCLYGWLKLQEDR